MLTDDDHVLHGAIRDEEGATELITRIPQIIKTVKEISEDYRV